MEAINADHACATTYCLPSLLIDLASCDTILENENTRFSSEVHALCSLPITNQTTKDLFSAEYAVSYLSKPQIYIIHYLSTVTRLGFLTPNGSPQYITN